ncbi:hypothetical protein PAMP_009032 [Pampus punctatissimus]
MMIWVLCLLCVAGDFRVVHAGLVRKTSQMEDMAAPQDEVNVLMFGVIQFSESLNYVYETTEAKIAKIRQTLKSHESALQQLGKQTGQTAEVEKEIKEVIQLLQGQMAKQQDQTTMTKDWLAQMEKEEVELKAKVKKLEMYLNDLIPISVKELQVTQS